MLKKSIFLSSSILLATCSCWADVSISGSSKVDYKSSTQYQLHTLFFDIYSSND
jgi:hypothetical protein